MAQVINFDEAVDTRKAQRCARPAEQESDNFWPEVSCGLWVKQPEPANSPRRVLTEITLILAGAALLVLLTTVIFGAPTL